MGNGDDSRGGGGLGVAGQALGEGIFHKLDSGVEVELLHDLAFMKLDCARGYFKGSGDVFHCMTLRQKLENFSLTGGEFRPRGRAAIDPPATCLRPLPWSPVE